MLQTIQLANRAFHLPVSIDDSRRRSAFFETGDGSLLPEEQEILTGLGISKDLENILKPYLAAFFDGLITCQSDTSLILQKECEVVHYVLWQTLLASRFQANERIKKNKEENESMTDNTAAMNSEIISGLQPKPDPVSDLREIFTLLFTDDPLPAPVESNTIRDVFTLILTK